MSSKYLINPDPNTTFIESINYRRHSEHKTEMRMIVQPLSSAPHNDRKCPSANNRTVANSLDAEAKQDSRDLSLEGLRSE
ncbi:hypothetical protein WA026_015490 [Henosepilachna vigintioctopunctata]|uniref:Uncharacterized protein n=1 Tax=Henosepilachna vigintioctopunctata TaxID=420089 RepID=A0AAW1ULF3_9CUCU